jgi:peptide/nickel transport system substrate-binding protein
MMRVVWVLLALALPLGVQAQTKVLRVIPHADLTVLDPMFASVVITRIHGLMVYETLFAWDADLQSQPQMVESWQQTPDGLVWSFMLRPGLAFHDGAAVTSADVIASLKRWMGRDVVGQKLASYGAALEAMDARSFRITLKRAFPNMLFALGSGIGQIPVIMRASDLDGDPAKPVTTAVGSGPFRFNHAARISGALTVFDRNPAYQPRAEKANGLAGGRVVKVDRVEWKVVPDAATAAAALQAGEVDLWEQPALDLLPLLRRNANIRVQKLTSMANQTLLRPNALNPPFDNPKARLALAYIINQEDVLAGAFGDPQNWATCRSYFICGGPYSTLAGTEALKTDLARARTLLAEAGYKGETLIYPSTHEIAWLGAQTEVIADALKRAGVNVEVIWSDWGSMGARLRNQGPVAQGGWNLFNTGASGPTMHHPITNIGINMACDRRNFTGWPCDEASETLRQAFIDAAPDARAAALEKLHMHLVTVQPYVPLGQYDQPVALRSSLSGLLASPVIAYWNIAKD